MKSSEFFERKGPFPLKEIVKTIGFDDNFLKGKNFEIFGFESLDNATKKDMTFLNSSKYKKFSLQTKAIACITSPNLSKFLPEDCIKLNRPYNFERIQIIKNIDKVLHKYSLFS